ncbi:hypothetical protein R5R35_011279 [Gryllus longicercus]|uniref:Uncharacterized protein n=1 Tax=Gryllus longicercus TaxID=2509291 RepID=A0AAN9Z314_9ORTH
MLGAATSAARLGRLARRGSRALSAAAASGPAPVQLRIDDAHLVRPKHPIHIPVDTLPDLVWRNTARWQDKIAIECGVTGRRLTYAQLRDASRRLAVALRSARMLGPRRPEEEEEGEGGRRGADAAVLMANAPEFPVVMLGAAEARVVLSTINPAYTPEEVGRQLADNGARVVFADAACVPLAQAALARRPDGQRPLLVRVGPGDAPPGVLRFEDITGPGAPLDSPDIPEGDPNAVCVLPYSSGTTGLPKGVLLAHRALTANMHQIQHPEVAHVRATEGDFQDVIPAVLPFFHIYGMVVVLLNSLCMGAKVVSLPKFDPAGFVRTMIEKKATGLFAAPPLVLFLAGHPSVPAETLASLRFVLCGAAPLAAADAERLLARASHHIDLVQGYGMTEASPVLTQGRKGFMGAVGPPLPATEAVVINMDTLSSVPHGQEGELCFRGPQVMNGYWQRPEDTASTLVAGGWLRTGDVGRLDENGDFLILDRAKELIKVKGFQVAPAELEALLREHAAVAEAAVVGLPDARAGELPCAYVVPRAPPGDAAAGDALRAALAAHVARHVARHKQLAGGVRLVADIPKNASGKILRRRLRDEPPPEIAT